MADNTADPGVNLGIESHSIDFISPEERHGTALKQGFFWFMPNFNFFSIALGFVGPSLGLSLTWSIVAGVLGMVFGSFFMGFHASQGPQLGLPQMIQSRAQFGYLGVVVPTAAVIVTFIVFNVLDLKVLEDGLDGLYGLNGTAVIILSSLVAATLAIFGHDLLHKVFRILFWVSVPAYLVLTIGIVGGGVEATARDMGGFTASAFMAVFAVSASYNITLAPDVSDYTRYLPADTGTAKIIFSVTAGASLSAVWLMAMGSWLAIRMGATDGLVGLHAAGNDFISGLGSLLALLSVVGLITVIGINTYSAVIGVATVADSFRPVNPTARLRIGIALVLLVVWVLITLSLANDQFTLIFNMLSILLYLLVPWTAVNLVDFFFVRRGHYAITEIFDRDGIYGVWAWRGLTAYFIALAAEVPFMVLSFYKSPVSQAINGIDIAFIVGLVVAGGAYLLFARSLDLSAEAATIRESELTLARGVNPELPQYRD
ncbi:Cytosine/purines, uracil, thiamine, allantoin permease [metagenome]|uniref:Cytosine/purines, uracil, thiamine, allantoin permease n=1 Tax=metagenome TaxID=256318 RepID=A0A2P2C271_9ZZZZ